MLGSVEYLDRQTAIDFILPKHYSGRKPPISWAFGWRYQGELKAAVTYGKPASNTLCNGICGAEYADRVYELNRLVRLDDWNQPLSQFVAATLRRISIENLIIVSYADTGAHHNGYIYQATNFIYTGKTKERLEFYVPDGHSRHGSKDSPYRQIRTAKHRYVYFATKNKKIKSAWKGALNYPILPYPKDASKEYALGTFLTPTVVEYKPGSKIDQMNKVGE